MKKLVLISLLGMGVMAHLSDRNTTHAATEPLPVAPGPFAPTMESLKQYRCPDWFRDAKFGIWAHWGPQAVPMAGDWYARQMYLPGHPQYQHHLENYGHPSTNGYKDIIPLWKAEKWDPERLMALYKRAGAKYFVSMGSHHDNFYLWNSKLHRWNSVNMGPKRDVVKEWQQAAQRNGLRFGVSEHLGASFTWFQPSHKADTNGPRAGVKYDGADPRYEDLYHFPAEAGDTAWYSNNPRWQRMWFDRIQELVDQYHPDLLYTDGGVPFGNEVGRSLIAHLYNSDPRRRGLGVEAIYTCKQKSEGRWIEDLERGVMARINPDPWQTDTSIGDWFYNKNWKFRPVSWSIHMLVDIVSKNGNLLLNVVQRPDGSLDPEVEQALEAMASWIKINGDGIYGTRPWLVYGEGPVQARGGHFKEDFGYTARDLRFTTKGNQTLYAFALGWPEDRQLVVRSLAKGAEATGQITAVELLGHGHVQWTHDAAGLTVQMPPEKPCDYAIALKITCSDVTAFHPEANAAALSVIVQPDGAGLYTLLPTTAEPHGNVNEEVRDGQPNLGFWDDAADFVTWKVNFRQTGPFRVSASCATPHKESMLVVEVSGQTTQGRIEQTGDWGQFKRFDLGEIEILKAGPQTVSVRPKDPAQWKPINLRWVKFDKVE